MVRWNCTPFPLAVEETRINHDQTCNGIEERSLKDRMSTQPYAGENPESPLINKVLILNFGGNGNSGRAPLVPHFALNPMQFCDFFGFLFVKKGLNLLTGAPLTCQFLFREGPCGFTCDTLHISSIVPSCLSISSSPIHSLYPTTTITTRWITTP
jgi:hypothetical protein